MNDEMVVVRGRLDASQAEKASLAFAAIVTSATVDLAELEYISSAGISVFVEAQLRLQQQGHTLRLVNVHPRVRAVLHYASLSPFFGMD